MKKIIISLGNPLKSDDNIGNLVLDELKKRMKNKDIHFFRGELSPENFIGKIRKLSPDTVFFIDAVVFDGEVGSVKTFEVEDAEGMIPSTHNMSLKILKGLLPDSKTILIGLRPKNLEYGESISDEIRDKFDSIIEKVENIVQS